MKRLKLKELLITLISILVISSSLIACNKNNGYSSSEKEKPSLESSNEKNNSTNKEEDKIKDSKSEKDKNRFEGIETTSEDMNIPVLCYHDVTPNNPNNNELLVNPNKFKEQLQYLKDNNYTPITLDELYSYLRENKPLPKKPVVITLDDGYKGNYEYAYPLLKEFNFPATIFVISNYVGAKDYMTNEELKEMSDNGIEIESHTFKHDDLSTLDENKQFETFKSSKEALEKITGKPVDYVAYPFGRYNEETRVAAKKAGYKLGFNLNGNFADRKDNDFNIDRVYVSNNDSLEKFESRLKEN